MALGASHFQWFALMATPHLGVEPSEKDPKRGIPSSVDPQWQVYTKKNINCMYRLDTKMSQKRTSLASKHFYFRRKLSYFTIFEQTEISMLK